MSNLTAVKAQPKTLREALAFSKMTLDQIAAKANCSKRSLINWRSGKRPNDYFIGLLSDILGVNLWHLYAELPHEEVQTATVSTHLSLILSPSQRIATPTYIIEPITSSTAPQIDLAIRAYIAQQLNTLWETFHTAQEQSGVITLQLALNAHMHMLHTFNSWQIQESERQWLLRATCEATILAGRLARDQMNHPEAIAQHKQALRYAAQSGSPDHVAAAAMRLAESLWEAGMLYEAVSYCQAAIEQSKNANPRIRGELFGFAAMAYGTIGDLSESDRLANEAAVLAVGAAKLPTAGGINFSETAAAAYLLNDALRRGDTIAALRHAERARKLIVIEFPESRNVRWEAHIWINQARAYQEAKEIEEACHALSTAAQLAHSINSLIALRKVQDAASKLAQRQQQPIPALRSLHDELMHITSSRVLS